MKLAVLDMARMAHQNCRRCAETCAISIAVNQLAVDDGSFAVRRVQGDRNAKSAEAIAIIGGTGAEGGGIALRLAKARHRAIIGSRDPLKAASAPQDLDRVLGHGLLDGPRQ